MAAVARWLRFALAAWVGGLALTAAAVSAQPAPATSPDGVGSAAAARAELETVSRERARLAAALQSGEADCKRRVLVNDCLDRLRAGHRAAELQLKNREGAARRVLRDTAQIERSAREAR